MKTVNAVQCSVCKKLHLIDSKNYVIVSLNFDASNEENVESNVYCKDKKCLFNVIIKMTGKEPVKRNRKNLTKKEVLSE